MSETGHLRRFGHVRVTSGKGVISEVPFVGVEGLGLDVMHPTGASNELTDFKGAAIATRYDKLAANYLAFVKPAAIRIWLRAHDSTP
jgi:hypothetical protein